jgi:hypothetical protein
LVLISLTLMRYSEVVSWRNLRSFSISSAISPGVSSERWSPEQGKEKVRELT